MLNKQKISLSELDFKDTKGIILGMPNMLLKSCTAFVKDNGVFFF